MIETKNGNKIITIEIEQYLKLDDILHNGDENREGLVVECDYSFNTIKAALEALKQTAHNITVYSDNVYLRDKINIIERSLRSKVEKLEKQHNEIIDILNYFI